MTAERWQQVERLYQQAAAQSPSERAEFLWRACDGDHELRHQLNRLLPGIGPYEIVALLGAGGMGEVYKARDTRLNRPVALKALPQSAAGDSEQRKRLLGEARTASALLVNRLVALRGVDLSHAAWAAAPGFCRRGATCRSPQSRFRPPSTS